MLRMERTVWKLGCRQREEWSEWMSMMGREAQSSVGDAIALHISSIVAWRKGRGGVSNATILAVKDSTGLDRDIHFSRIVVPPTPESTSSPSVLVHPSIHLSHRNSSCIIRAGRLQSRTIMTTVSCYISF